MKELKRAITEEFKLLVNNVTQEFRRAEEDGDGIDLTNLMDSLATRFKKIDDAFIDGEQRYLKNKKGFAGG